MPRRVLKLDAKGRPRQRANDADVAYGIVWKSDPFRDKYLIAIAARRIGDRIYTMHPDKIGKAIKHALKAPITEEERKWAKGRADIASTNPDVKAGMDRAIALAAKAADVDLQRTMQELGRIGFSDLRKVTSWGKDGVKVIESDELSDDAAAAVAEVSEVLGKDGARGVKVKMHSKPEALASLARLLAPEKQEVPPPVIGSVNLNVILGDPEARRALEALARILEGQSSGNSGQVVAGRVAES